MELLGRGARPVQLSIQMPRPTFFRSLRPVDGSRAEHLASRRQPSPRLLPGEPSSVDPGTSHRLGRAPARRCSGDTCRLGSGSMPEATPANARGVASAGMRSQPSCRLSRRSASSSTAARRRRAPASCSVSSRAAMASRVRVSIGHVLRQGQRPCLLDASTTLQKPPARKREDAGASPGSSSCKPSYHSNVARNPHC
jgi:hypothetical protein